MIFAVSFPRNLTAIDPLTLPDHKKLIPEDECYFLGEYTAYEGYRYSDTNQLIINLKKPMSRRDRPAEWKYKGQAIVTAARALKEALPDEFLYGATFIPIPPSKAKSDPMYDDRMTRVLQAISPDRPVDYRELIIQNKSAEPVHESGNRDPAKIFELYSLDETLLKPRPNLIVICDDVLTTGAHFKAAQAILSGEYKEARIIGCFIARRAVEEADPFDDFEIIF